MKKVLLKTVGPNSYFQRKVDAKTIYQRGYFYRKSSYGPECIGCLDTDNMNREIFLKPSTMVYVDA
jgi:hypothetical protein